MQKLSCDVWGRADICRVSTRTGSHSAGRCRGRPQSVNLALQVCPAHLIPFTDVVFAVSRHLRSARVETWGALIRRVFCREGAERYGIDPQRVALGGDSAGASITASVTHALAAIREGAAECPGDMELEGRPDWAVLAAAPKLALQVNFTASVLETYCQTASVSIVRTGYKIALFTPVPLPACPDICDRSSSIRALISRALLGRRTQSAELGT
jgi:hypothetical protein